MDITNQIKKYVQTIVTLEKHLYRLTNHWIIDTSYRDSVLTELHQLTKQLIDLYSINCLTNNLTYPCKNSQEIKLKMLMEWDRLNQIEQTDKLLQRTKNHLCKIMKRVGFETMVGFLEFLGYPTFQLPALFMLYNQVFVPLKVTIEEAMVAANTFVKTNYDCECDGLIDKTVTLQLTIKEANRKFIFNGYIGVNFWCVPIETSALYSGHLLEIKQSVNQLLKKSNMDHRFLNQYDALIDNSVYFINETKELVVKIKSDYQLLSTLSNSSLNTVIEKFVKGNVSRMFRIIYVLLMGKRAQVKTATLLYNLLKTEGLNAIVLRKVIYQNLSFNARLRLKTSVHQLKDEIKTIKELQWANVPLEQKIATVVLPLPVKNYILQKQAELTNNENSYKLQMAVDGLLQFPWKLPTIKPSEIMTIDKARSILTAVKTKLNEKMHGNKSAKTAFMQLVAKWIYNSTSTGQVIGLVGPPGTGKTLMAKSMSEALDIPMAVINLGGLNDAADLIGHSYSYNHAQYGAIIKQMIKNNKWRSILFFDELDKVSKKTDTNEIYNVLIHLTDPMTNAHFQDRFYSTLEFDLSGVLFVFSYNDSHKIDPVLLDRITEIKIAPYTVEDKIAIARYHILPFVCRSIDLPMDKLIITDPVLEQIITHYTLEPGVRNLKRQLEQIILQLNMDRIYLRGPFRCLLSNAIIDKQSTAIHQLTDTMEVQLTPALVKRYLGQPTLLDKPIHSLSRIGIMHILHVDNNDRGGVTTIQIQANHSNQCTNNQLSLKYTGNCQKIMIESVECALAVALQLVSNKHRTAVYHRFPNGFHVHCPQLSIPKDGSSAGIALVIAFLSVIVNSRIHWQLSATGEIDLIGNVLKIDGLHAKLIAAKRVGLTDVYLSKENELDYQTILRTDPLLTNDHFRIHFIDKLHRSVLKAFLMDSQLTDFKN